ncbi:hypothetical protein ACWDRB_47155 [Nonomuraea sp. NPDC003707]
MTTTNEPTLREFAINVTISGVARVQSATKEEARALATQVRITDLDHTQGPVTISEITVISAEDLEEDDEQADTGRAECEHVCGRVTETSVRYCPKCKWAVDACDRCNTCRTCGCLTDALPAEEHCANICRAPTEHTEQDCGNCGPVTACATCNICPKCGDFTRDDQATEDDDEPDIDAHLDR